MENFEKGYIDQKQYDQMNEKIDDKMYRLFIEKVRLKEIKTEEKIRKSKLQLIFGSDILDKTIIALDRQYSYRSNETIVQQGTTN
jgi:hypothetical protein